MSVPARKLRAISMEVAVAESAADVTKIRAVASSGKRDKFIVLAENRTKNAIKAIRVIAKLGNKNAYEFTETDVNKIAKALIHEVEQMKTRMSSTGDKESVDFTL
jgi:ribosomal protein L7/L12